MIGIFVIGIAVVYIYLCQKIVKAVYKKYQSRAKAVLIALSLAILPFLDYLLAKPFEIKFCERDSKLHIYESQKIQVEGLFIADNNHISNSNYQYGYAKFLFKQGFRFVEFFNSNKNKYIRLELKQNVKKDFKYYQTDIFNEMTIDKPSAKYLYLVSNESILYEYPLDWLVSIKKETRYKIYDIETGQVLLEDIYVKSTSSWINKLGGKFMLGKGQSFWRECNFKEKLNCLKHLVSFDLEKSKHVCNLFEKHKDFTQFIKPLVKE